MQSLNVTSILTIIFTFLVGLWVHTKYLKKQPIWVVVLAAIALGEALKLVFGVESIPLQIFKQTDIGSQVDETIQTSGIKQYVQV